MRPNVWKAVLLSLGMVSSAVVSAQETVPSSLTFEQALQLAKTRHVEILAADKRVQQALTQLTQARSPLLPQLDGTLQQSRRTVNLKAQGIPLPGNPRVGPFNTFDARLHLTQTLFDPATVQRLRAAERSRDLSLVQQRKSEQDVMALVATLYIQAVRAEEGRDAMRTLVQRDTVNATLAHLQLDNGTGSEVQAELADAALSRSQASFTTADTEAVERRQDLFTALGLPASPSTVLASKETEFQSWGPFAETVITQKAAGHPDVQVAQQVFEVGRVQKQAVSREALPQVRAAADYGASGELPKGSLGTYGISAQLAVPIFSGGSQVARVKESQKRSEENEVRLKDTELRTEGRAQNANASLRQALVQMQSARSQWKVVDRERQLAQQRLDMGTGSEAELVEAEADAAIARDQYRDAVALAQIAQVNLAHALSEMEQLSAERKPL